VETSFVEWLRERVPADARLEVPLGDDAAVLRVGAGRHAVLTVDMLTDGVDFLLADAAPAAIGHKALAVNLSDLAAMGATPEAVLVAVALPRSGAADLARGLHEGIAPLAARFGVALAGGDTNTWDGPLAVSITAVGSVAPGRAWRRDGARPGDLLVVTGPCGGSLLGRHLRPEPRCKEAETIAARHAVHAAIDVSDGLSLDLHRLLHASRVRGTLDLSSVPIHEDARKSAQRDGIPPLDHALADGEDFELVLAMPPADARALIADPPGEIRPVIIGTCAEGGGLEGVDADGTHRPLEPRGWTHDGR